LHDRARPGATAFNADAATIRGADATGALISLTRAEELLRPLAAGGDFGAPRRLSSVLLRIATITRAKGDRQGAAARYEPRHSRTTRRPRWPNIPSGRPV